MNSNEDFDIWAAALIRSLLEKEIDTRYAPQFTELVKQIHRNNKLNPPITDKTQTFLQNVLPSIIDIIMSYSFLSAKEKGLICAIFFSCMQLLPWSFKKEDTELIKTLIRITNSKEQIFLKNSKLKDLRYTNGEKIYTLYEITINEFFERHLFKKIVSIIRDKILKFEHFFLFTQLFVNLEAADNGVHKIKEAAKYSRYLHTYLTLLNDSPPLYLSPSEFTKFCENVKLINQSSFSQICYIAENLIASSDTQKQEFGVNAFIYCTKQPEYSIKLEFLSRLNASVLSEIVISRIGPFIINTVQKYKYTNLFNLLDIIRKYSENDFCTIISNIEFSGIVKYIASQEPKEQISIIDLLLPKLNSKELYNILLSHSLNHPEEVIKIINSIKNITAIQHVLEHLNLKYAETGNQTYKIIIDSIISKKPDLAYYANKETPILKFKRKIRDLEIIDSELLESVITLQRFEDISEAIRNNLINDFNIIINSQAEITKEFAVVLYEVYSRKKVEFKENKLLKAIQHEEEQNMLLVLYEKDNSILDQFNNFNYYSLQFLLKFIKSNESLQIPCSLVKNIYKCLKEEALEEVAWNLLKVLPFIKESKNLEEGMTDYEIRYILRLALNQKREIVIKECFVKENIPEIFSYFQTYPITERGIFNKVVSIVPKLNYKLAIKSIEAIKKSELIFENIPDALFLMNICSDCVIIEKFCQSNFLDIINPLEVNSNIIKLLIKYGKVNQTRQFAEKATEILLERFDYNLYTLLQKNSYFNKSDITNCVPVIQSESTQLKMIKENRPELAKLIVPVDGYNIKYRRIEYDRHGLRNLGNTCYMNSILQQLFYTTEFFNDVINANSDLRNLFIEMKLSKLDFVDTKEFAQKWNGWYGEKINTIIQQDAYEFFNLITDNNNKAFEGEFLYSIKSKDSSDFVTHSETFSSIQAKIKGFKELNKSLDFMIAEESLEGDNKYRFENGKLMDATRSVVISKAPNNLVIQLMRFEYDVMSLSRKKINDYFTFPTKLNLKKFTSQNKKLLYYLTGIVIHKGTASSGHYYSIIRIGNDWFKFNDKNVSKIAEIDIQMAAFGDSNGRESAYMLFYQRYPFQQKNPIPEPLISDIRGKQRNELLQNFALSEVFALEACESLSDKEMCDYVMNVVLHSSPSEAMRKALVKRLSSMEEELTKYVINNFERFAKIIEFEYDETILLLPLKEDRELMRLMAAFISENAHRANAISYPMAYIERCSKCFDVSEAAFSALKLVYGRERPRGYFRDVQSFRLFNAVSLTEEEFSDLSKLQKRICLSEKNEEAFRGLRKRVEEAKRSTKEEIEIDKDKDKDKYEDNDKDNDTHKDKDIHKDKDKDENEDKDKNKCEDKDKDIDEDKDVNCEEEKIETSELIERIKKGELESVLPLISDENKDEVALGILSKIHAGAGVASDALRLIERFGYKGEFDLQSEFDKSDPKDRNILTFLKISVHVDCDFFSPNLSRVSSLRTEAMEALEYAAKHNEGLFASTVFEEITKENRKLIPIKEKVIGSAPITARIREEASEWFDRQIVRLSRHRGMAEDVLDACAGLMRPIEVGHRITSEPKDIAKFLSRIDEFSVLISAIERIYYGAPDVPAVSEAALTTKSDSGLCFVLYSRIKSSNFEFKDLYEKSLEFKSGIDGSFFFAVLNQIDFFIGTDFLEFSLPRVKMSLEGAKSFFSTQLKYLDSDGLSKVAVALCNSRGKPRHVLEAMDVLIKANPDSRQLIINNFPYKDLSKLKPNEQSIAKKIVS